MSRQNTTPPNTNILSINKPLFTWVHALLLFATTSLAHAADIANTDLIQFSPNTPVNSADFNSNFNTVKSAVNSKQDKITQSCSTGSSIRQINADGSVQCENTGTGSGGGIAGVVSLPSTGVIANTNVSNVVTIELDNALLDGNAVTAIKSADGSGSTLDADFLDGKDSTNFVSSNQSCMTYESVSGFDLTGKLLCTNNITNITAGTGLSGGGTSGPVTLSVDVTKVQSRVTGACPSGSSIIAVAQDGTVTCDPVAITDVVAGKNLAKSGSAAIPQLDVVGMPGVAYVQDGVLTNFGTTLTTVATLTVNVPSNGYIIVNASGTGTACTDGYGSPGTVSWQLEDATTIQTSPTFNITSLSFNISSSYVFPVTAVSNTINLNVSCIYGTASISAQSLTAIFVPTNITGP